MNRAQSLSAAGVLLMAVAAHAQVEQGDRWETPVANATAYANPYKDVTLNVTMTAPDGKTIPWWGFYDGAGTWRVRWMPDRPGTWRYDARFSDGRPGKSGTFTCTASNRPGTVRALASNPRWFATGDRPFLMRSFQASGLFKDKVSAATRTAFLDWAAAQGYNTFSSTSFFSTRNATDTGGPKLWPLDFNHFRRVETVLNDLSRRGMVAYAFTGFFPNSGPYPTAQADQTRYIRYCLARFAPYWNVILNVGGFELRDYLSDADIRRLGAEIAAADPFKHLLGAHQRDGDDIFRNDAWCSFATLQHEITNLTTLGDYLRRNYAGKPVYGQETLWMGNTLQPAWTTADLRKHMWVHMMSGAAYNAGDMTSSNDSGFSATLNLADRKQERHDVPKRVWDFMATVPYPRMNPRQDLRTGGFMLAEPGAQYLCYLPSGGAVDITVTGGPYAVEWINARDPMNDRRPSGTTADGRGLRAPDTQDWLVYLTPSTSSGVAPAIDRLRLMNADTDQPILDPLPNGATINLAALPSRNITIQALTTPSTIGSVRFAFDGNANYRTESAAPYVISGDDAGDLRPWTVALGTHSVGATPFSGSGATGTGGTPVVATFTLVDQALPTGAPAIDRLRLMNADTDQPILSPLPNGAVIDLASLPSRNITIQALTTPSTIGSVRFSFDGTADYRIESSAPYAIAGDDSGNLRPWSVSLGTHAVGAVPYSASGGTGTAGTPVVVTFTLIDGAPSGGGPIAGPGTAPPPADDAAAPLDDRDNDNGDGGLNDRCGGAVAAPGTAGLFLLLAVVLASKK